MSRKDSWKIGLGNVVVGACAAVLAACGGGGGGGGGTPTPPPSPTVTLTASPTSVLSGGMATLTWSSTNATTCTASGGWQGSLAISGTQQVGPLTTASTYSLTCGTGNATASASATVAVTPPVSAAGALAVPASTQVDSDTNDAATTPIANNSFALAQALPNPSVTGGYATLAGAGEDGPLRLAGDPSDYYRVSLLQGQVIELRVANATPATNDLDLELYSSTQTLVNASAGVGAIERLTVATSGQYFVRVLAFGGASNYILTIGQTGSTAVASNLVLSSDFVPGEALVQARMAVREKSDVQMMSRKHSQIATAYGLSVSGNVPGMHALMTLTSRTAQMLAARKSRPDEAIQFESEEARLKWETLQAIKALSSAAEVEWAEPNLIYSANAIPNDPFYPRQRWHYEQIGLPAAWDINTGSTNVIAAVIDTGVRPHQELGARLVSGFDFVRGVGAGDGGDDDNDASDPGTPSQGSYVFHGTHVAGTIGAAGNDGQGVTGVAWNVRIMPVRTLGVNGSGSVEDIVQGMLYAAGLANRSGLVPPQRADVINMSLGGPGLCTAAWQDVINRVRNAGVIIIASAGNDGVSGDYSPAGCGGVVSVSSVDINRVRAPYSNFGIGVDVAAPGGDMSVDRNGDGSTDGVYSTYSTRSGTTYTSTYALLQGTSMAAPHVTGVVALMKSVNPTLTPAAFDSLLTAGSLTDDIGPAGPDVLGVGLINAAKAVRAASATPPVRPAQLSVAPANVNFGDVISTNDVSVSNSGTGTINVTSTATSAPWLTVTATQVGTNGLGIYRIQVNRTGLAAGTYNGWVEFRGSVGTAVRTTVLMQVAAAPVVPNAGHHYLLLIDPTSGDTSYQVEVEARGASVNYQFAAVAPGSYELVAGTDLNNDGFICDEGEACAEFPLFGESAVIDLTSQRAGLNLLTGFRSNADALNVTDATVPPVTRVRYRLVR